MWIAAAAATVGLVGAPAVAADPIEAPPVAEVPDTGPRVRVNQLGYLPTGPKRATLVSDATSALRWQLRGADGAVVAEGDTTPQALDASSGLATHLIDFGEAAATGSGFTLTADGETSYPFTIAADIYASLRTDALSYFYPVRSGIEIDGSVAGAAYARAAGHIGVAPNLGDTAVPCLAPRPYLDDWSCDYTRDVRGGWYDAGDHGKYVVNGGIAVSQLMSTYERGLNAASTQPGALGDDTLRIPERDNAVADVLDEARWELGWLLRMQVPAGEDLAGMAFHKVHDDAWTGLPLLPADDPQPRSLHRPSTAATLNLVAAAAQGARLFRASDPGFADALLAAARVAYNAALAHPAIYAPAEDGNDGGGAYNDYDVSDEFYWAAAELYLTTGESEFLSDVTASPWHSAPATEVFRADGFDWGHTAALAALDLATVPSSLPDRRSVVDRVVAGADAHLAAQQQQAFGQSYAPTSGRYDWGSNSLILNNQVVIATAYDLTGRAEYRDAVLESMDYLLGRNALNISYITGYGSVFSHNQHSRWFAHSLDAALPSPPIGAVAGGPNSSIQDPVAQALFADGCAPQFCYTDDIQSWSTNEITVNWNSALSWVASFVADQGAASVPEATPAPSATTSSPVAAGGAEPGLAATGVDAVALAAVAFALAGGGLLMRRRRSRSGRAWRARSAASDA